MRRLFFVLVLLVGVASPIQGQTIVADRIRGAITDKGGQVFNVKAYGATGDGVTDDATAIQALVTTVSGLPSGGRILFPPGTYALTSTITLTKGIAFIGSGDGQTTLAFSGTGYLFDVGASVVVHKLRIADLSITTTAAATGAIRIGTGATAFNDSLFRTDCVFSGLTITGPGATEAGTIGVNVTQLGRAVWDHVMVGSYETAVLIYTSTESQYRDVTVNTFRYGLTLTRVASQPAGAASDVFYNLRMHGPVTGADGYAIKLDTQNDTFYSTYLEVYTGGYTGATFIWLTASAQSCKFYDTRYDYSGGTVTNHMVFDAGASYNRFTNEYASKSGALPVVSMGNPAGGGGATQNVFVSPDYKIVDALAVPLAAGYATSIAPNAAGAGTTISNDLAVTDALNVGGDGVFSAMVTAANLSVTRGNDSTPNYAGYLNQASNGNILFLQQTHGGGNALTASALMLVDNRGANPSVAFKNDTTDTFYVRSDGYVWASGFLGLPLAGDSYAVTKTYAAASSSPAVTISQVNAGGAASHASALISIDNRSSNAGIDIVNDATTTFSVGPAGDVVVGGLLQSLTHSPPATTVSDLGSTTKWWRTAYILELLASVMSVKETLVTSGGSFLVTKGSALTSALANGAGDTTITVKHNTLTNGSFVVLQKPVQYEVLKIVSTAGGAGPYSYTVERDKDGSGRNAWTEGDSVVSIGAAIADGWVEQYATGAGGASRNDSIDNLGIGPASLYSYRTAATNWNDFAVGAKVGRLDGHYGYASNANLYGSCFGLYAVGGSFLCSDPTNGVRMTARIAGPSDVVRFQLAADGSGLLATNGITWTAAGVLTIGGTTGWVISANAIKDVAGTTGLSNAVTGGDDIRFWAGHATMASAPFQVTEAGVLTATSATITGTINATAGYFGTGSTKVAINSDGLDVGNAGRILGGMTAYNTGTGFFLGYSGAYKFAVGHDDGNRLTWDGTDLTLVSSTVGIGSTGITLATTTSLTAGNAYKWDDTGDPGLYYYHIGAGDEIMYLYNPAGATSIGWGTDRLLTFTETDITVGSGVSLGTSAFPFDKVYATTYYGYRAAWFAGVTDTYSCGAGKVDTIEVAGGIVTSVGCGAPSPASASASSLTARIASLEQRIAELETLLNRRHQ